MVKLPPALHHGRYYALTYDRLDGVLILEENGAQIMRMTGNQAYGYIRKLEQENAYDVIVELVDDIDVK